MSHCVTDSDALGLAMYEHQTTGEAAELMYRDGASIEPHDVQGTYFTEPADWRPAWRRRLRDLEDPLLDVGCGAGKHSKWLQSIGRRVIAIDASRLAVHTARRRGVDDVREMDMFELEFEPDQFASAVVIGTQSGLAGSLAGVGAFLADLAVVTLPGGVAIIDSYDPREIDSATFLGYRADPRRGVAHRCFHFEYRRPRAHRVVGRTLRFVLFSPDRLRDVLVGTPWELAAVWLRDSYYRAKLVKRPASSLRGE